MSFVLDALKRQQADGDPDAAVALATSANQRQRHRFWRTLFVVAMAVNGLIVLWLLGLPDWLAGPAGDNQTTTGAGATVPAVTVDAPARSAARQPAEAPVVSAPAQPVPRPATDRPVSPEPAAPRTARSSEAAPSAAPPAPLASEAPAAAKPAPAPQRIELGDLSADARRRFPGIAFSTHIYAQDRDLRAIVANGQRLTEGDSIRGLEILEITEGGVVLQFERYEVEVPIVTDWDDT